MSIDGYRLRRRDPNDTHCHCGHKWSDGPSRHNEATHDRIAELEAIIKSVTIDLTAVLRLGRVWEKDPSLALTGEDSDG